jgi:hypothetical protein
MESTDFFFTLRLHLSPAPGILNKSPILREQQGYARQPRRFVSGRVIVVKRFPV